MFIYFIEGDKIMVKPIKMLPARDLVASKLRKAILTGKFQPGEELRQDKIAEMLGVSRMPVREAIRILTDEGLLKTFPNKSAVVSNVPENYIKEHFEVRILLECEAVARAVSNLEDLSEIVSLNEEYKDALNDNDIEQARLLNEAFHILIWDAAQNLRLKSFLTQLWNGLSFMSGGMRYTYEEHEAIIDAFRKKDPEQAKNAMKIHLEHSMNNILKT
jgi:DNA-binding GntR family transcriptional regulator